MKTVKRTVKRQAQIGEKIIITKRDNIFEPYSVGSVLTVQWREDFEMIHTEEGFFVFDDEYEVIVEEYEDNILPPPTSDKEMVDKLIEHFLGKDWYSVNPMPREQVNTEAMQLIMDKHPTKKKRG